MSRKKNRFQARFANDDPIETEIKEEEPLTADFGNTEQLTRTNYNFGDGLKYDENTNTVSADVTDEITIGDSRMVTSDAVANAISNSGIVYSSDEQIIGKWDGRTLYQRVITANNVMIHNDSEQSFEHGIENVDMMLVPEVYLRDTAIGKANGNFMNVTCGVCIGSNTAMIQWVADDTYIWVNSTSYFNASENRTWKIVVRYTKANEND